MSSRDDISLSLYFRTILDGELTDKTRFSLEMLLKSAV